MAEIGVGGRTGDGLEDLVRDLSGSLVLGQGIGVVEAVV